jgi:hypothetical protein
MTMEQFCSATQNVQQTTVKLFGSFLLRRKAGRLVATLYQLNDFYVEIIHAPTFKKKTLIRCHTVKQIDTYLNQIDISALTNLLKEPDGS